LIVSQKQHDMGAVGWPRLTIPVDCGSIRFGWLGLLLGEKWMLRMLLLRIDIGVLAPRTRIFCIALDLLGSVHDE
jgi:hypothetical protein